VQTITPPAPPDTAQDLLRHGNYAAAALDGDRGAWQTFAALGLVGKARDALEGLARFGGDEPAFYAAVTRWIDGDDAGAAAGLERLVPHNAHARNLLNLIRKPRIRVLTQLPWTRTGCSDLLAGSKRDAKFQVENVSFHPDDRPNLPYADVHQLYNSRQPPDFYVCQMVEWHMLPPNLTELPCPLLGQTADYDLHVQAVHPWLQLFDELVVTDPSEWCDVRGLATVPVSTFPKSFGLPAALPATPGGRRRDLDLFLSGTVTHPYHPDKATLLHQILSVPGLRLKIINGFKAQNNYLRTAADCKLCVTYVRHPTAMPTRGLESLAMGCAVIVQEGSVLTLYAGAAEGVLTYDLDREDLTVAIGEVVNDWPAYQKRAARGAALIRREFALPRVASQYVRFLTFLAARPRRRPVERPAETLFQKRLVLQDGWLPDHQFDHSPLLKRNGLACHARFMAEINAGPTSSHAYLDAARESVLYNFHRARNGLIPCDEWLDSVAPVYRRGVAEFPRSLPLRFNFGRVLLHFGGEAAIAEGLGLLDDTLARPTDDWTLDVMEDVFPWDFFPQFFNYRDYFDLITRQLTDGSDARPALRRLILASLNYYRGFHAPYRDFHSVALDYFRRAVALDPAFPYYRYHLAEELVQRGLPDDDAEAVRLLSGLLGGSILFLDAFQLLSELADGVRPPLQTPGARVSDAKTPSLFPPAAVQREVQDLLDANRAVVNRAHRQIEFVVGIAPAMNRTELFRPRETMSGYDPRCVPAEINRLRAHIRHMESSKFWKLRRVWVCIRRLFGLHADDIRL
jgi:hypothetical protein